MKQACISVGANIWTLEYEDHNDGTITILNFDRGDGMFAHQLPVLQSIQETDGRVADKVTINGTTYDVRNKQNVYSYKQPL